MIEEVMSRKILLESAPDGVVQDGLLVVSAPHERGYAGAVERREPVPVAWYGWGGLRVGVRVLRDLTWDPHSSGPLAVWLYPDGVIFDDPASGLLDEQVGSHPEALRADPDCGYVAWGDGTTTTLTTPGPVVHTYAEAGTYQATLTLHFKPTEGVAAHQLSPSVTRPITVG